MRTIAIIPARGGSKGIPRKNIRELSGKPLIAYTIEAAQDAGLQDVIVSTDDEEIARVAASFGAAVIMRPAELAADETPTLPVLQHVVKALGDSADIVVTLQPTSPLRTSAHLLEALKIFDGEPGADSLVSVVRVPHSCVPESIMVRDGAYLRVFRTAPKAVLRRQDKPVYWARNGAAIYITKRDLLSRAILGDQILPFEMSKLDSIDLDDMEDWELVEALLQHRRAMTDRGRGS